MLAKAAAAFVVAPRRRGSRCGAARGPPGCTITGTARAETLQGTPGRDVICGLGGKDILLGHGGNDRLLGGDGAGHPRRRRRRGRSWTAAPATTT